MPKMFIKFTDKKTKKKYFVGWSTITDCVNTDVMDSKTFKKTVMLTDEQQKSLDKTGCSNPNYTIRELIECSDEFRNRKDLLEYCKKSL
jgi:hypothetical protein